MEPQITTPVLQTPQTPPVVPKNKKSFLKSLSFGAVLTISILSIVAAAIYLGAVLFEYSDVYNQLAVETKRGYVEDSQLVEYETPYWATYIRAAVTVAGFPLTLLFLPFAGNDGFIGFGILSEIFGIPIIFLFWFIVLSLVWSVVSQFRRKQGDFNNIRELPESSTKGKAAVLIISVLIVLGLTFGKQSLIKAVYKSVDMPSSSDSEPLVVSAITPDNGKKGDVITIFGSGFANKTLIVWLSGKKNNKHGLLWKGLPTDDSPISFILNQSLCPVGFDPCPHSRQLFNKGEYEIRILGGGPDVSLPFQINEDVVISNKQSIPISSFTKGGTGIGGGFKNGTLTVDAVDGAYVWIWAPINNTKPVSYLEFDVVAGDVNNFNLGVYIDNKLIGRVSTEFSGQKVQKFSAKIDELPSGSHTLSLRLDSFNWENRLASGYMIISNVMTGYVAD
jgi:hypothetical protein